MKTCETSFLKRYYEKNYHKLELYKNNNLILDVFFREYWNNFKSMNLTEMKKLFSDLAYIINEGRNFKDSKPDDNEDNSENIKNMRNTYLDNKLLSIANAKKSGEINVYFNVIKFKDYNGGYEEFCGVKILHYLFYGTSLYEIYTNIIQFLYYTFNEEFNRYLNEYLDEDNIFSKNVINFRTPVKLMDTDIYFESDLGFQEMLDMLNKLVENVFGNCELKILSLNRIRA